MKKNGSGAQNSRDDMGKPPCRLPPLNKTDLQNGRIMNTKGRPPTTQARAHTDTETDAHTHTHTHTQKDARTHTHTQTHTRASIE